MRGARMLSVSMSRVALMVVVALSGCQRDNPPAPPGTERSDCRPDGTCDPGLSCLSKRCVKPPPANCQAVAETLASFDLGNYAPLEERGPVVARHEVACKHAHVSKDEGACIDQARDKWTAAQCAPRLFPELASATTSDCVAVRTKIRASYGAQGVAFENDPKMSKWFATTLQIVQQSCEQDRWPDAVKRCILASGANGQSSLTSCNHAMPPPLQQKLQDRMVAAMKLLQP
jgi:hypothetical protein